MAKVTITLHDSPPPEGQDGISLDLTVKIDMEGTLFTQAQDSIALVTGMGLRNLIGDHGALQRLITIMRSDATAFREQLLAMTNGNVSAKPVDPTAPAAP